MAPRRLGILNDIRLFLRDGAFCAEDPMILYMLDFRRHFDEIVFIARVFDDDGAEAPYRLPADGVRVVPLPPYPRIGDLLQAPWRWWPDIDRALRSELPGLTALWLTVGHPVSNRALSLSARQAGLRCFGFLRGDYVGEARHTNRGLKGQLAAAAMQAGMTIFARRASRRQIPCFGYADEQVEWLHARRVPASRMVNSLVPAEALKNGQRQGGDGAPAVTPVDLLYVGRLNGIKGVDVLLDAMPGLVVDGRPVRLRVVGDGPDRAALAAQAQRLGVAAQVDFAGQVPHGPALFAQFRSARIFVQPSRGEGTPKTTLEAMAFGLPVVASEVGGLGEVLGGDPPRGVLLPPGRPELLHRALQALLDAPARLDALARAGRSYGQGFTLQGQVDAIVAAAGLGR